jgi:site-specific recombinase XerD
VATLGPFISTYLRERRRRGELTPGSSQELRYRLVSLSASFGERPVGQFDRAAVEEWLESIGHLKPASRRAYFSTATGLFGWMVRRGHLHRDPTLDLPRIPEPRTDPRALSPEKVARLLRSRPDTRSQVVIWLMVGIGLRCAEVTGLEVDDYDPAALTVFIRGKGSHERLLTTPAILAGALNLYLEETGIVSGPFVRHLVHPDRGLSAGSLSEYVSGWMMACGIKHQPRDGISAHSLRHTCASDVLDECGDLRIVQRILGHANIATTSRYLRIARLDQLRDALEGRTYREESVA